MILRNFLILFYLLFITISLSAFSVKGRVMNGENKSLMFVKVKLNTRTVYTDTAGYYNFVNVDSGVAYTLLFQLVGFDPLIKEIGVLSSDRIVDVDLLPSANLVNRVVVSGGLKEVSKSKSPVPIDVFSSKFLKANPSSSVFEALQNVNGVRPQNNCNVCNTGDIHINGLEGSYTMILIDGMPIVGGLSTVYGLNGIPQSLIERVEIVKGPASTLFGSEAVGGVVNVITRNPINMPKGTVDVFATGWGELNTDIAFQSNLGNKIHSLTSINYFNYNNVIDNNGDGFTDLPIQHRISAFSKFSLNRKSNKLLSIAGRFNYEDRWGGQIQWNEGFRGGDSVYGESIFTKRWEAFGTYELPTKADLKLQFSSNAHFQNSYYGTLSFMAEQQVHFTQFLYHKQFGKNGRLLTGATYRYTLYDDNTPVTEIDDSSQFVNRVSKTHLPGAFAQVQCDISKNKVLLMGGRYDYNSIHGNIITPRMNFKWNSADRMNILRLSIGNGYRVANVFTEDHAALTGAREVVFTEDLEPEKSWNGNVNYVRKIFLGKNNLLNLDAAAWYTYFDNKIIPEYELNVNQIIYQNLKEYAYSRGLAVNLDFISSGGFTANLGATLMDVSKVENGRRQQQLLTERFSGVWKLSYELAKFKLLFDYTGNVYSPMQLPLLGVLDQRSPNSPWYSIQNIKLSKVYKSFSIYFGLKNLLNFTPSALSIARAHDPFDKQVLFDANGNALASPNNPQALTFDPSYVYASNQGRRFFLGLSYVINQ